MKKIYKLIVKDKGEGKKEKRREREVIIEKMKKKMKREERYGKMKEIEEIVEEYYEE